MNTGSTERVSGGVSMLPSAPSPMAEKAFCFGRDPLCGFVVCRKMHQGWIR